MHGTGLNFNTTPKTFQDCRSIHFRNFFLSIRVLRPIRTMKVLLFISVRIVFSESPVSSQASLTDIRILSLSAAGCFFLCIIYNYSQYLQADDIGCSSSPMDSINGLPASPCDFVLFIVLLFYIIFYRFL